jgi:hypothetical protein
MSESFDVSIRINRGGRRVDIILYPNTGGPVILILKLKELVQNYISMIGLGLDYDIEES